MTSKMILLRKIGGVVFYKWFIKYLFLKLKDIVCNTLLKCIGMYYKQII